MLLLAALIARAVSMEFRSKVESDRWRRFWDWAFFGGSSVASLLFDVAVGNAMIGLPLDRAGNFTGTLFDQLAPYPLLVGLLAVSLFAMHGAIYLVLKTDGELNTQVRRWVKPAIVVFMVMYGLITLATLLYVPHMTEHFKARPGLFFLPALNVLAVANIPREINAGRLADTVVSTAPSAKAWEARRADSSSSEMVLESAPAFCLSRAWARTLEAL
mgnify:CR=1 FL=1